jgi:far upstream element-binding protein
MILIVVSGSMDAGALRLIRAVASRNQDPRIAGRGYRRSRSPSRTPPRAMRENFRDNYNPYRDERRGGTDRFRGERSLSPRPGSRDYTSGPPAYSGARSPRRPTGGDDNSEIVPIEKNLVGLIIGRAGENLRRVESVTGARVQFMDGPETNSSSRHCKISGTRAAVASAKAEIYKVIDDNEVAKRGQGGGAPPRGRPAQPADPPADGDSEQILVPDRTVGLIIGRGGETIRDLQERSGCHVNIVGENKSQNGFRPVNLIGTPQQQQRAKDLIYEIVESDTKTGGGATGGRAEAAPSRNDPFTGPGNFKDTIMVPGEAVGMIIGKGGESIKDMQNLTGCKINVSQASGRDIEREIGLVAPNRQAIDAAKRAIMEKVDAVEQRNRAGGGGGSGGGGGREDHDPYGGERYGGQQAAPSYPPGGIPQQQAQVPGAPDPYAPWGGYQAYAAMWYAATMQQQQQQPGGPPPGEQR